jgi:hypothetical protein
MLFLAENWIVTFSICQCTVRAIGWGVENDSKFEVKRSSSLLLQTLSKQLMLYTVVLYGATSLFCQWFFFSNICQWMF